MRTKPTIYSDKETLTKALGDRYTGRIRIEGDGPFGLVVFTSHVARLNNIKHMLKKFPKSCTPIVAVRDITLEADELLKSSGGQSISLTGIYWIEE